MNRIFLQMADDRFLNVFAPAQVGCLRLEVKQADAHDGAGLAAERGVGLDRGGRRCKGRAERNEECCRKEAKGFHEGGEGEIPFRTRRGRGPKRLIVLQEFYATRETSMSISPACFRGR